jgi:polyisoprenoid-binding protein YceI
VARARLTRHLQSADFFWTERHPTAIFVLDGATRVAGDTFRVAGRLTLRGVTRPLAFPATLERDGVDGWLVRARLRIDRRRWGVTYRFDPIRNELVDDHIALALRMAFPGRR